MAHDWQMQDRIMRQIILRAAQQWNMNLMEVQQMSLREFIRWWEANYENDQTKINEHNAQ